MSIIINPRIKEVTPNPDYTITLVFDNGEKRIFDMQPNPFKVVFKDV